LVWLIFSVLEINDKNDYRSQIKLKVTKIINVIEKKFEELNT